MWIAQITDNTTKQEQRLGAVRADRYPEPTCNYVFLPLHLFLRDFPIGTLHSTRPGHAEYHKIDYRTNSASSKFLIWVQSGQHEWTYRQALAEATAIAHTSYQCRFGLVELAAEPNSDKRRLVRAAQFDYIPT